MIEADKIGSHDQEKDDEEIVELIDEMTGNLEITPESDPNSGELFSSEGKEAILELSEEISAENMGNGHDTVATPSAGVSPDILEDDIIELDMEAPDKDPENTPVDFAEEIIELGDLELNDSEESVLDLCDDAFPSVKVEEDVFSFSSDTVTDSLVGENEEKQSKLPTHRDMDSLLKVGDEDVFTFTDDLHSSELMEKKNVGEELEGRDVESFIADVEDDIFTFSGEPDPIPGPDDEDILALGTVESLINETTGEISSVSDGHLVSLENDGDMLELGEVESLIEEVDKERLFVAGEPTVVSEEPYDILDPGNIESLVDGLGGEPDSLLDTDAVLENMSDALLNIEEIPSLLPENVADTDLTHPARVQYAKDLVQDGFELGEALDLAIDRQMVADDGLVAALGLGLGVEEPSKETSAMQSDSGLPPVSSEVLEAAIERVLNRMVGEKIDRLLATAVEHAVTREIKRLKRLLAEILPDD